MLFETTCPKCRRQFDTEKQFGSQTCANADCQAVFFIFSGGIQRAIPRSEPKPTPASEPQAPAQFFPRYGERAVDKKKEGV